MMSIYLGDPKTAQLCVKAYKVKGIMNGDGCR